MKTILVPTDFSPAADNAAHYALQLAKQTNSNIKLCHAFKVPLETPVESQASWHLEDYASLKENVSRDLKLAAEKLINEDESLAEPGSFHPSIDYISEVGPVNDVVDNLVKEQKLNLVVMGLSGACGVSRFLLGSNTHDLIEDTIENGNFPLLLIPAKAKFNGLQKIAFTTDFSLGDIEIIHSLSGLAYPFNAEILIANVASEQYETTEHRHKAEAFLDEITGKINYHKIYYRRVRSADVEHGLDRLAEYGQVDMLAMVHRRHSLLGRIFEGSHTQKMARHINIPLLVFPADYRSVL